MNLTQFDAALQVLATRVRQFESRFRTGYRDMRLAMITPSFASVRDAVDDGFFSDRDFSASALFVHEPFENQVLFGI